MEFKDVKNEKLAVPHTTVSSSQLDLEVPKIKIVPLAELNFRRLLNAAKTAVRDLLTAFLFEPNDSVTRTQICGLLKNYFSTSSFSDYVVVCDETNNVPAHIDAGQLNVDIYVKLRPSDEQWVLIDTTLFTDSDIDVEDNGDS